MPRTRRISLAARSAASGERTGIPPATAASKRNDALEPRAISSSSGPWWATTCLLAVTTGFPAPRAAAIRVRAGSSPPITSMRTSLSGSATRWAGASVRRSPGTPDSRALARSRTATPVRVTGGPSDAARRSGASSSAPTTARPTVPAPRTATRSAGRVMAERRDGSRTSDGMVADRFAATDGRAGADANLAPTTTALAPAPASAAAPEARPRIFSGIQPSGAPHLGNDLGAIRNYVRLQWEYEAIYCIVDYHALTSLHDPDALRQRTREMAATLVALGLDTERCILFVQSHRPEHTELAWLLATVTPVSWVERTPTYKEKRQLQPDDVNHGLLTYPVLQAADIVIYKAALVPVGRDQAAHLELSREIVRAFNRRYGDTFPEPQAVFTEAPTVIGTDGVKKMSKSVGNTIDVLAPAEVIRKQVMSMVTDTQRILRSDPGRPEVCNVCQLQRSFGDDYESLWEGERTARTGCVDMKKVIAERIIARYADARKRFLELMAEPRQVDDILAAGAERIRPIAEATMAEVREKMGLR